MKTDDDRCIGIIVNPRKEHVEDSLKRLADWVEQTILPVRFVLCTYDSPYVKKVYPKLPVVTEEELLREAEMIITLGGDGTILRLVHTVNSKQTPILGVNLGGLGFLAETSPHLIVEHLEAYLNNEAYIEDRILLKCEVKGANSVFYALNDIVFDKAGFSRVIEIDTHVDDNLLNSYIADALIVSTPTGSTGYSLSAGGPIVIPQTAVFVINPICPHSLTNRPVVIPDTSKIKIQVHTEYKEINIFRDGEKVHSFPTGSSFMISKAHFYARLVRMKSHSFYDTLRNKLHWGEDFRDKKRWSYDFPERSSS
ncbi:MAG TPA: NAD(+) kinase [Caldithrix abyssi]|uniref:NAD kinase n=1 Tax=Caldithrix abyssi TaxID=187145 RepID=A0A7V4WVU3_CALAY|nr:NAD(+) kinase [Caldithrix abyssi]